MAQTTDRLPLECVELKIRRSVCPSFSPLPRPPPPLSPPWWCFLSKKVQVTSQTNSFPFHQMGTIVMPSGGFPSDRYRRDDSKVIQLISCAIFKLLQFALNSLPENK